ncbi:MAG TPA: lysozyme inhibitor LprI family protein [Caulobacteraceae bacterium]|nr:lysozyme inhibitor LprI family protein [Caulobacteraceae bacterium]
MPLDRQTVTHRRLFGAVAALCALTGASATAQAPGKTTGWPQDAAFHREDVLLNKAYRQVLAEADPGGRAVLRRAERDWIRFRDSECAVESYGAGTITQMILASCLKDQTDSRLGDLRLLLFCPEEPPTVCGLKQSPR